MVIIKLQGGLGNQMFQYAGARAVAKNDSLLLDTYFLTHNTQASETFTPRKLELLPFKKLRSKFMSGFLSDIFNRKTSFFKYLNKAAFKVFKYLGHFSEHLFFDFSQVTERNLYLEGYFQDERYFNHIREQLLVDFTFPSVNIKNERIEQQIKESATPVSIHVRRGDFLKPTLLVFNGLLSIDYYKQAIEIIESNDAVSEYFIFSDDPEWCLTAFEFLGDKAVIASGKSAADWEDMYLMSLCKHNIVANSSYSWWGAWLNNNPNKVVVSPQKWFYDMETNIIPDTWIKL